MKIVREFVVSTVIGGALVVVPAYLAFLLLLKAIQSAATLVQPVAILLPESLPAQRFFSLLLLIAICFVVGAAVRTKTGRAIRDRLEVVFFARLPGYSLLRSLTQRVAGGSHGAEWKPAFAEIQDGLVPAFVIEELDDGRFTVFVPSIPTPLAGAVYILDRDRVHLLDVPFTDAVKSISRWGSGSRDMVATMRRATDFKTPIAPAETAIQR